MLTACGILGQCFPHTGGTSKTDSSVIIVRLRMLIVWLNSFLIKDAQEDLAGERLKA